MNFPFICIKENVDFPVYPVMYEYVGKTQKSFMRGVITFSSGITYTLMPNWPSSKRKITIFWQMDQCVYYILKAIHACPNATWKVCSHILVSKKSRRESWHKRERHPMVRKFRGGENSSSKLVDTYSRGFIWDARNDALQGGPVRLIVCHNAVYKRLPKSLFCMSSVPGKA